MKIDPYNNVHQATDDFYRACRSDDALITSYSQELEYARHATPEEKAEAYRREGLKTPRRRHLDV